MEIAVLIVTLGAFVLRLLRLTYFNLSGDETISATFSTEPLRSIVEALRNGEPHPPLLYVLYHLWIPIAGDSEFALRFVAVIAGTMTVPTMYVVGARFFSRPAGLVAAIVLATNPYQLWNSQDARMYTLASLLCLIALLATAQALGIGAGGTTTVGTPWSIMRESERPRLHPPRLEGMRWGWLAVYVVAISTALYTHYYSVYEIVLLNAFAGVWLLIRRPRLLPAWIGAQALTTALFVPWVILAWRTITSYSGYGYSPSVAEASRRAFATFATGYVFPQDSTGPIFWFFVLVLVAGALLALRRNVDASLLLLVALLAPPIGVFVASHGRPIFNERYLMESSLPFCLLIGAVALGVDRRYPRAARVATPVLLGVLVFVGAWLISRYETTATTVAKARNASVFGAYLAAHAAPNDRVVFNILDPTFLYYYQHAGGKAPTVIAPSSKSETVAELDLQMAQQLAGADHVWIMPDGLRWWDVNGIVPPWLDRHLDKVQDLQPKYQLVEYRTIQVEQALSVPFGPDVVLTGSTPKNGVAVVAGSDLPVTLLWRTSAPLHTDYMVSVQLLAPDGHLAAQSDGPPEQGQARTPTWRVTEAVPDEHTLRLPSDLPPGDYAIGVAVYDLTTLQRLPVVGAPDGLATIVHLRVSAASSAGH